MNTYKIDNETTRALKNAIAFHEDTRGYYYWSPSIVASGRRANEKRRNEQAVTGAFTIIEALKTKMKGHTIYISQDYSESCHNVYVNSVFYFDDKKTTVTKIRNILANRETPPTPVDVETLEDPCITAPEHLMG